MQIGWKEMRLKPILTFDNIAGDFLPVGRQEVAGNVFI